MLRELAEAGREPAPAAFAVAFRHTATAADGTLRGQRLVLATSGARCSLHFRRLHTGVQTTGDPLVLPPCAHASSLAERQRPVPPFRSAVAVRLRTAAPRHGPTLWRGACVVLVSHGPRSERHFSPVPRAAEAGLLVARRGPSRGRGISAHPGALAIQGCAWSCGRPATPQARTLMAIRNHLGDGSSSRTTWNGSPATRPAQDTPSRTFTGRPTGTLHRRTRAAVSASRSAFVLRDVQELERGAVSQRSAGWPGRRNAFCPARGGDPRAGRLLVVPMGPLAR